jgi:hypothetical protein
LVSAWLKDLLKEQPRVFIRRRFQGVATSRAPL